MDTNPRGWADYSFLLQLILVHRVVRFKFVLFPDAMMNKSDYLLCHCLPHGELAGGYNWLYSPWLHIHQPTCARMHVLQLSVIAPLHVAACRRHRSARRGRCTRRSDRCSPEWGAIKHHVSENKTCRALITFSVVLLKNNLTLTPSHP